MGFIRTIVQTTGGLSRAARGGDGVTTIPAIVTSTIAGNATIGLDAILGGIARFTSAAAAATYTTPTAAALIAAMPMMDIGDIYTFRLVNTTAFATTLAGGTGVTAIAGNLAVTGSSKLFALVKTSATTMDLFGL